MSLGKGAIVSISKKQKLNTKSSTEAELVGADEVLNDVLWMRNFLVAQGYPSEQTVLCQDNTSAILLEKNGRESAGKRSHHVDIRYFFIKDCIDKGKLNVEYCPTNEMVADFFTKPLQGIKFNKFRKAIMNLGWRLELFFLFRISNSDKNYMKKRIGLDNRSVLEHESLRGKYKKSWVATARPWRKDLRQVEQVISL